jgi:hypothetical protein
MKAKLLLFTRKGKGKGKEIKVKTFPQMVLSPYLNCGEY